ncbi:uncharacterized protein N7473_000180 [Penicillium subrubescens]|uniref:uncharacterized protein n=1 Tax=Penicillium subrubescens TaxID=1316194 RepID=UPI00254535A2|nr:uncharacterized protein N7473_000180 [Penicillium subrubescens]KAJ5910877.1 hypothetical protein N7473_000180 [Penicillium subrubescens]
MPEAAIFSYYYVLESMHNSVLLQRTTTAVATSSRAPDGPPPPGEGWGGRQPADRPVFPEDDDEGGTPSRVKKTLAKITTDVPGAAFQSSSSRHEKYLEMRELGEQIITEWRRRHAEQARARREQREEQRLVRFNSRGRGRGGPYRTERPGRSAQRQATAADNQPTASGEGRQDQGTRRDDMRRGAKKDEKGKEKK